MSDGYVEDDWVECPLHQARFDIVTGKALSDPATIPLQVYPVKIENNRVFVEVD
jgi:3-phenylpropionate/trans-cinnamate dioxygenase ferredoxin subunit